MQLLSRRSISARNRNRDPCSVCQQHKQRCPGGNPCERCIERGRPEECTSSKRKKKITSVCNSSDIASTIKYATPLSAGHKDQQPKSTDNDIQGPKHSPYGPAQFQDDFFANLQLMDLESSSGLAQRQDMLHNVQNPPSSSTILPNFREGLNLSEEDVEALTSFEWKDTAVSESMLNEMMDSLVEDGYL